MLPEATLLAAATPVAAPTGYPTPEAAARLRTQAEALAQQATVAARWAAAFSH